MNNIAKHELYIGFMSGTSLDGVDASLVDTNGADKFKPIANLHLPYPADFREQMQKFLGAATLPSGLERQLTEFHIEATLELLKSQNLKSSEIRAIGFHGQTIYHKPQAGITVQAGDACFLAQNVNIDVIYDFRTRDVSNGGEGAPLVPIFHKLLMQGQELPVVALNIGGVANITYIDQDELIAFDTGPGVALIDDAMSRYFQKPFDVDGEIAASGRVDDSVVMKFLADEYFILPYPKSLDRNRFKFLDTMLASHEPKDIVATLTCISAVAIVKAFEQLPKIPQKIFLCGGGSKNTQIIFWLKEILASREHKPTIENISKINGLDPDYIESQAFGYLAARFVHKLPSTFPETTNTKEPTICGRLMQKAN